MVFYSDCLQAIELLHSDSGHFNAYTDIIYECRELSKGVSNSRFHHVPRSRNLAADTMAKEARRMADETNIVRTFPYPPNYCLDSSIYQKKKKIKVPPRTSYVPYILKRMEY